MADGGRERIQGAQAVFRAVELLKLVGLCDSGGAGKNLVATGAVSVDGKKELRKTAKIRAGQVVSLGDVRITVQG